jgi:hypothetical protein
MEWSSRVLREEPAVHRKEERRDLTPECNTLVILSEGNRSGRQSMRCILYERNGIPFLNE